MHTKDEIIVRESDACAWRRPHSLHSDDLSDLVAAETGCLNIHDCFVLPVAITMIKGALRVAWCYPALGRVLLVAVHAQSVDNQQSACNQLGDSDKC